MAAEAAPDLGLALERIDAQLGKARKYLALVTLAVGVAVVVLILDYMIKNAIIQQIRAADRTIGGGPHDAAQPPGFPPRGGDTDPHSPPVGRMGMVTDSPLGEGALADGGPVSRPLGARRGGPPPSTDRDAGRTGGGAARDGGVALPPDGAANPPE